MRKTLSIIFILAGFTTFAQQDPVQSQYVQNHYLINPGAAGSFNYLPLRGHFRRQWTGIAGSPSSAYLTGHKRIGENMAAGAMLEYDVLGPVTRTGINLTYAYALKLGDKDRLSFGLSALGIYNQLNASELTFDPNGGADVVQFGDYSNIVPDVNFGVYASGDKYFTGISLNQILKSRLETDSLTVFTRLRQINALGGYRISASTDYVLEPSLFIRYVDNAPVQMDVNLLLRAFEKVTAGVSWRSGDALVFLAGATLREKFHISYSYDFTLSALRTYSGGTHEIMLGVDLFKNETDTTPSISN